MEIELSNGTWYKTVPESDNFCTNCDLLGSIARCNEANKKHDCMEHSVIFVEIPKEEFLEVKEEEPTEQSKSALDVQISGSHYKTLKIQPIEFIHANNIPFIEGNVIKYICRWRSKNGIKDLEKVKHYVDLLIELEKLKGQ